MSWLYMTLAKARKLTQKARLKMNLFSVGDLAMLRFGKTNVEVEVLECNATNFKVRNPLTGKEYFTAKVKLQKHQNFTREVSMEENTTYEEEFPNPAPEGVNAIAETVQNVPIEQTQQKPVPVGKKKPLLEFAIECMKAYNEPMSCKEIIVMAESVGWERTGKTPEQSLYSGIFREIQTKGLQSRFRKSQIKGKFELAK